MGKRFKLPRGTRISRGKRGLGASTGTATGCLVLVAASVLLALVARLVEGVIAAFSTIWPWLILALLGLGYAARRLLHVLRRQQSEKRFFDAVIALATPGMDAGPLLSRLCVEMPGEADVPLLLAAHAAHAGDTSGALVALDMALPYAGTLGRLSGGLTLRFPGMLAPLSFALHHGGTEALQLVRNEILVRLGRAAEAVATKTESIYEPLRAFRFAGAANANMALGNIGQAIVALEQAVAANTSPEVKRALRYRLAIAFEARGLRDRAIAEYSSVLDGGDYEDARARMNRLVAAAATIAEEAEARRKAEIEAHQEAVFQGTIAKMEAARGSAGRRAALDTGLREVVDPQKRERLLVEASRIEVKAVLDKVDGLKTVAAKRRNLLAALDTLRSDDVPDELQAKQIGWLEGALAELEGREK